LKILGNKKEKTPLENLIRMEELIEELNQNSPLKKKKGRIFKFQTWQDHYQFSLVRYKDHYE
jgi:hypothetical protein